MNEQELFRSVGETIDRMMSIEVRRAGFMTGVVPMLYQAARADRGEPLAMSAGKEVIAATVDSDVAVMLTGHLFPELMPHGETDGPPGAAALASILGVGLGLHPIVMCDEPVVQPMVQVLRAAGLLANVGWPQTPYHDHRASVIPLPTDLEQAQELSSRLFDKYGIGVVISVEKISPNRHGLLHSGLGSDLTGVLGRADAVIDEARSRGVYTVGIGDVGNELGFGRIADIVRTRVPYGDLCRCPCSGGTAASVSTDSLLVAGTSNWGAYALEAAISALLGRPELIHSGRDETRMLEAAVDAGAVDGLTTSLVPGADGLSSNFHSNWIQLLREAVSVGCDDEVSSRISSEVGADLPSVDDLAISG